MTQHFAEYYYPGILFSEETTQKLSRRSPAEAKRKAPKGTFGFKLYDTADVPKGTDDYDVIPKAKNRSRMYYLGGTLHNLDEVETWGEEYRILASNMRGNNWPTVIRCMTGNFQPFQEGDQII